MFSVIIIIVVFNISFLIMAVQPFKSSLAHYNLLNVCFIQLIALILFLSMGMAVTGLYMKQLSYFFVVLIFLIYPAALFYCIFCVFYWIFKNRKIFYKIFMCRISVR